MINNLQRASKAYDKLMHSIGEEDYCVREEIERGGLEVNYTIADLVAMVEENIENNLWVIFDLKKEAHYDDDAAEELEQRKAENRKYKRFISRWKGVE